MGMSLWPRWANNHGVANLQAKTILMNLIKSESAQWLLSYSIHNIPGVFITPMSTPM